MAQILHFKRRSLVARGFDIEEWPVEAVPEVAAAVVRLLQRQSLRQPTLADGKLLGNAGRGLLAQATLDSFRERLMKAEGVPLCLASSSDQFPLEFAHPGDQFLALSNVVSRYPGPIDAPPSEFGRQPLRGLILADSRFDLLEAHYEAADIRRLWAKSGLFSAIDVLGSHVSIHDATQALGRCDWLHVCGHAEATQGGGWLLRDGFLTSEAILKATQHHAPALVFANACGSAAPHFGPSPTVREAFLRNGCRHFVGTLVPIPDRRTKPFVKAFYHALLSGEAVGLAVLSGRRSVSEAEGPASILWGSYVHYGHPCESVAPVQVGIMPIAVPPAPRIERQPTNSAEVSFPVACQTCGRAIHTVHGLAEQTHAPGGPSVRCRACARTTGARSAESPSSSAMRLTTVTEVDIPPTAAASAPAPVEPVTGKPPWLSRLDYAIDRFIHSPDMEHSWTCSDQSETVSTLPGELRRLRLAARDAAPDARPGTLNLAYIVLASNKSPVGPEIVLQNLAPWGEASSDTIVCLTSSSGWENSTLELVTGSPSQAYFSPRVSLVLLDGSTGRFHWRKGDGRVESVKKLFDLETDEEKFHRIRDAILARCPLETSVAATTLQQQFDAPLPLIVAAMRSAARSAALYLDEIPGYGWVLS